MLQITLPDGSVKLIAEGTTFAEIGKLVEKRYDSPLAVAILNGPGRNLAYQLFRSPAWKIRFPSVSTIHETPLSVLPNAHTETVLSDHVPPLASHTSASSLLARRCL